ncbi:hypothetical protein [Peribacillus frigoritolerans]|uniref:hypothetical protein n=1 Tax=Peribacillus TaxID=2675229 RepID=UPI003D7C1932
MKAMEITSYLFKKEIIPALHYTHPRTNFRKQDYVDEYIDCYLCPLGELLKYSTTNKEGYREHKSPNTSVQHAHFYLGEQKAKTVKKW